MIKKILLITAFGLTFGAQAQNHTVSKGDTPYNISKKYGLSLSELYALNPSIKDGKISIGQELVVRNSTTKSSSANGYIILQPKQTIYGITKQYHITEQQLRSLNPDLESKMKIGNRIVLPLANIQRYGKGTVSENSTVLAAGSLEKYTVEPRDNYYKITRKFKISQQELFASNPGLESKGLKAGDIIVIPASTQGPNNGGDASSATAQVEVKSENSATNDTVQDSSDQEYVTYTVKSGDTVFGILNRFGITLDQLLTLNPELSSGLRSGMVLRIKVLDAQYSKKSGDALNVVIMLPFGFDSNDSRYRSISTDFLTGAKLAIERSAKGGQKLDVKIVDAGNEQSFKQSLSQINKDNTDLIIGPLFKSSVLEVLDYIGDTKIPVVAPFANSEDLYGYNNLIIVETTDKVYAEKIADEVKNVYSNQKIYIVGERGSERVALVKASLEKQLKNGEIVVVSSPSAIQLDKNMATGQDAPVIAVLASNEEGLGEDFGKKVIELSSQVSGVKAFSMYYNSIFESRIDELSQANLVYLMDRKVNTDGKFEKQVLGEYDRLYCKMPSKYAIIGFDVVSDVLSRENAKGEIFKQIGKVQTQLATKFEYVRAQRGGAYINTGYRVIRLVP